MIHLGESVNHRKDRRSCRLVDCLFSISTVLTIFTFIAVLTASSPTFWNISTQLEFLRGDVESLTIDADGHLALGPITQEAFSTTAPALWSLAMASDGAFWAGSGNDGRLYRIESNGDGKLVFDSEEIDIHAVMAGPEGSVFAASSPDGSIYSVTPDGVTSIVFDPSDTYIWALAMSPDGELYAATGDPGRIYRIPPNGEGEMIFESDAAHVTSLAFEARGTLLAGTESPGQVIRIGPGQETFVLLDSPYTEVRSIRAQPDGSILVVAINEQGAVTSALPSSPSETGPSATVSVSTSATAVVVSDVSTNSTQASSSSGETERRGARGAIYRIAPDGLWDVLWSSNSDAPYDAVFNMEGALLIGTGDGGKVYQVSDDPPKRVLLTRAPARQVTRFLQQTNGTLHYVTANPGKVFLLASTLADEGSYESEVHDTKTIATWGTLRWRGVTPGDSRIELSSRSGNTGIPDSTWSNWSNPYTDGRGTQIASPKARYIQWRASLFAGESSPTLTSVTTAYLPRNLRPEVTEIIVHPPGTVFQQPFTSGEPRIAGLDDTEDEEETTSLGREGYRKGVQTFVWQATDENGDQLEYTLSYRKEDETEWYPLRSGLREKFFAWDTSSVPAGAYRIRVTVSDYRSNAPENVRLGELESPVFDVDNTAPRIDVSAQREGPDGSILVFTVTDGHSPVHLVEISKGDDVWQILYPTDGIPDSLEEQFRVAIDTQEQGNILLRATDALRNTVTIFGR